jgi:hypothetical protein
LKTRRKPEKYVKIILRKLKVWKQWENKEGLALIKMQ